MPENTHWDSPTMKWKYLRCSLYPNFWQGKTFQQVQQGRIVAGTLRNAPVALWGTKEKFLFKIRNFWLTYFTFLLDLKHPALKATIIPKWRKKREFAPFLPTPHSAIVPCIYFQEARFIRVNLPTKWINKGFLCHWGARWADIIF